MPCRSWRASGSGTSRSSSGTTWQACWWRTSPAEGRLLGCTRSHDRTMGQRVLVGGALMKRTTRWLLGVLGVGVLAFGLACLNYTKADGREHHQEVARRHGLPEPGEPILYGGVAAVVLGAGLVGFVVGVGKKYA